MVELVPLKHCMRGFDSHMDHHQRPRSSTGQSTRLLIERFQDRTLAGVPLTYNKSMIFRNPFRGKLRDWEKTEDRELSRGEDYLAVRWHAPSCCSELFGCIDNIGIGELPYKAQQHLRKEFERELKRRDRAKAQTSLEGVLASLNRQPLVKDPLEE